jgi:hypothetical protein
MVFRRFVRMKLYSQKLYWLEHLLDLFGLARFEIEAQVEEDQDQVGAELPQAAGGERAAI